MRNIFLLCLLFPTLVVAQRVSVSGYITDQESGESLIGANIFNVHTKEGTSSNTFGFYSVSLNADSVRLRFSYVGYQSQQISLKLRKDTVLNVQLVPLNQLKEVTITAEQPIEENSQMSLIDIPIAQIKSVPALLGEVDVLKVIQLLPGVQSGTEGSSGIYVRGGGPDQNLILLDGVPVYNASHLFGFFSVFNADAINKVELIKGGFPARYGGRLSSVIDISMKEGNMNEFHGEGGIGIISSRLTLEGPIAKNKASFIVSARRTYIDILARPLIKAQTEGEGVAGYYFYDLNGKINYKFSDKDRIYLSTYTGDDRFYTRYDNDYYYDDTRYERKDNAGLNWGNVTSALRWNHIINPKLFSNTTLTYSRFRFNIYNRFEETTTNNVANKDVSTTEKYQLEYLSGIRDLGLKFDLDYLPTPDHYIKGGINIIHHKFNPGAAAFDLNSEELPESLKVGADPTFAVEHALYVEDDYKVNDLLKVNGGLHYSGFAVNGKHYNSLQPRFSARYLLQPTLSLKASYARMAQFIHLLTNSSIGLPTDLWVPATDRIRPQQSQQVAMGLAKTLNSRYEVSLEGYYKDMDNLIEYKEGASFLNVDKNWENKIATGRGWSYGAELFLQKKTGKTTGWIGYTLSWTERQFEELNEGRVFPYKYDRRHDLSVVLTHRFNERTELSGTWVYGTGVALTLPIGDYKIAQNPTQPNRPYHWWDFSSVKNFSSRNEYRMPHYHRMDIGLSRFKKTKWGERRWVFGVYNIYNRENLFFMDISTDNQGNKKFVQYSLFQFIPSISFNFSF